MKTWIVITEIFLLGLWVDDWGLGVEAAAAGAQGATQDSATLTPTPLFTTFMDSLDDSCTQRWSCPAWVRPPPRRKREANDLTDRHTKEHGYKPTGHKPATYGLLYLVSEISAIGRTVIAAAFLG